MPDQSKPKNITGPTLRLYRERTGLTYAALSRLLREHGAVISPRRLKHMEEQTCRVTLNDLDAFARVYKTSITAFFP